MSDFISITGDVDKALVMMRKTAEMDDVVAASYKDQIAHYTQMMLRTDLKGEREPVISTMRMLGEPEFNVAQEIERVWEEEQRDHKDFVEKEHRVREFVAKKVNDFWEAQMEMWIGKERMKKAEEVQRHVHGLPAPPAVEKPPPEEEISTLEAMRKALEERIEELKKAKK